MHLHTSGYCDRVAAARLVHRRVMAALTWPGSRQPLPLPEDRPDGLPPVAAALMLALCDSDTPVYLPSGLALSRWCATWLRLHCQAAVVDDPGSARYLLCRRDDDLPLSRILYARSNGALPGDEDPLRDRTLLLEVASLRGGLSVCIQSDHDTRREVIVDIDALPTAVLGSCCKQDAHAPLGIDIIAFDADSIIALPRGVRLAPALDPVRVRALPGAVPA